MLSASAQPMLSCRRRAMLDADATLFDDAFRFSPRFDCRRQPLLLASCRHYFAALMMLIEFAAASPLLITR